MWQKSSDILRKNSGNAGDKLEIIRQNVVTAIAELETGNYSCDSIDIIDKIKLNVGSKKNWQDITLIKEALQTIQKSPTIFKRSPVNPNTFIYTENRFNTYIFYSVESDYIQVIDIKGQAQLNEYM